MSKKSVRVSVSILGALLLWEIVSRSGLVPIALFPPPTQVAIAFGEMVRSGDLVRDLQASLWRAFLGFLLGSSLGITVGLATGRAAVFDHYISPLLQLIRPLPPVAIIPLVILWFGIGDVSKIFSIAFAVFFPVWINTHVGAQTVSRAFLWTAQTLRINKIRRIYRVILPAAFPLVLAGLRNGIAVAFVMVFVSELAGASVGIGYEISVSNLAYRVDRMIAALIVLGLLGALADFALTRILWFQFPWSKMIDKR
jgi:ABC-type nitrate/sulfonate/bicarbonate transport system permease component